MIGSVYIFICVSSSDKNTKIRHRKVGTPAAVYATCILRSVNNAWEKGDYKVDVVGMMNSWQIVKGAFIDIVVWSLLRLAEFREGRDGMLCAVHFLVMIVETTIAGGDLSALDMSTWNGCALAGPNRLFLR